MIGTLAAIRQCLRELDEGAGLEAGVRAVMDLVPRDAAGRIGAELIRELVSARLRELRQSGYYRQAVRRLDEVTRSNAAGETRSMLLPFERDLDRAEERREHARARQEELLAVLAAALTGGDEATT